MTKIELNDKQLGLLCYAIERARTDNEGPLCFESIVIDEYVDADEYPTNDELDGEEDERRRNKAVAADLEALYEHIASGSTKAEKPDPGWRDVCPETFVPGSGVNALPEYGAKEALPGMPFWRRAGLFKSENVLMSNGHRCWLGYYEYDLVDGPFSGAWYQEGPDAYRLDSIIKWMPLPKA